MRIVSVLLIPCILIFGCTSSRNITTSPTDLSDLAESVEGKTVQVLFRDGREIDAREVKVFPDSTTMVDESGNRIAVRTLSIRMVSAKDHGTGFLEGIGIGSLSGAALGLLLAVVWVGKPRDLEGLAYAYLSGFGAGAGFLVGGIMGLVNGHTDNLTIVK